MKTFEIPPPPEGDPIQFEVGGRKFTCLPRIPVGTRMMMRSGAITKGDTIPFVRGCLDVPCRPEWDQLVNDPKVMMDDGTCEDIFWYLVEEYASREGSAPVAVKAD